MRIRQMLLPQGRQLSFFVLSEDDNFFLDMAIFHEICKKMEKELKMSHNASLIHNMTAIHMRLN